MKHPWRLNGDNSRNVAAYMPSHYAVHVRRSLRGYKWFLMDKFGGVAAQGDGCKTKSAAREEARKAKETL